MVDSFDFVPLLAPAYTRLIFLYSNRISKKR